VGGKVRCGTVKGDRGERRRKDGEGEGGQAGVLLALKNGDVKVRGTVFLTVKKKRYRRNRISTGEVGDKQGTEGCKVDVQTPDKKKVTR